MNLHALKAARTCLLATLAVMAFATAAAAQAGPKVSHFTLDNGLTLVVIPDRRAPVVTHMIWYKVGAADEVPGKSGIAHFLEHLMFKGTEKNPAGRFSQVVATIGGQENAFTSQDYTGYYQRVPKAYLKEMMDFESDRMTGLVLTDQVVLPERDVILEERNQRIDNNPRARLGEQIDAALYLNEPYHKPVIGWRNEMERLTRDDAIAFYKKYYAPNNAIVVVAGDVEPDAVLAMAKETYGKIPKTHDFAPRLRPKDPPPAAVRSLTLADPRVEQPSLSRSYLVPSFATAKAGESEAIEVLAHILGHGSNSRLYTALVVAFDRAQRKSDEAAHIRKLEDRIRSRRVVFTAVLRMMRGHALSEEDAFALIRQTAMRHRMTIEQLSAEIIAAGGMPNRISRTA